MYPNKVYASEVLVRFQERGWPVAYNLAFDMLFSVKLLFFKSLKNALCFSDNARV